MGFILSAPSSCAVLEPGWREPPGQSRSCNVWNYYLGEHYLGEHYLGEHPGSGTDPPARHQPWLIPPSPVDGKLTGSLLQGDKSGLVPFIKHLLLLQRRANRMEKE